MPLRLSTILLLLAYCHRSMCPNTNQQLSPKRELKRTRSDARDESMRGTRSPASSSSSEGDRKAVGSLETGTGKRQRLSEREICQKTILRDRKSTTAHLSACTQQSTSHSRLADLQALQLADLQDIFLSQVHKSKQFAALESQQVGGISKSDKDALLESQTEQTMNRLQKQKQTLQKEMKTLEQAASQGQVAPSTGTVAIKFYDDKQTELRRQMCLGILSQQIMLPKDKANNFHNSRIRSIDNTNQKTNKAHQNGLLVRLRDLYFIKLVYCQPKSQEWLQAKQLFLSTVKQLQKKQLNKSIIFRVPSSLWAHQFDYYYELLAPGVKQKVDNLPKPFLCNQVNTVKQSIIAAPFYPEEPNFFALVDKKISETIQDINSQTPFTDNQLINRLAILSRLLDNLKKVRTKPNNISQKRYSSISDSFKKRIVRTNGLQKYEDLVDSNDSRFPHLEQIIKKGQRK